MASLRIIQRIMINYSKKGYYTEMPLGFKCGWASSNVVGYNLPPTPLVEAGLTELPNSGWAKAHPAYPAHPLTTSLLYESVISKYQRIDSTFT